jgi:hypothetical protein
MHQNGASDGDRCGNVAVAIPGNEKQASAGDSACRRSNDDLVSARKRVAARTTTSLS